MTINSSTALITGGTSGIGRAAANKLARLAIHVLVVGRNAEGGKKTVDEIRAAGDKRILFRLTCETHRVPAQSREEQPSSEAVMSIF